MDITGFSWAGVRAEAGFDDSVGFFRDVLGLALESRDDAAGFARFHFPSGQDLEVFHPRSRWYALHHCPVIAFEVPDIEAARAELGARGVELIGEMASAPPGDQWCYFRSPDGHLYELVQHAPRP